jgi:hypothetical protein
MSLALQYDSLSIDELSRPYRLGVVLRVRSCANGGVATRPLKREHTFVVTFHA